MNRFTASVGLVLAMLLLSGCPQDVTPYTPVANDVFCVFRITAATGAGAMPVGTQICVICPRSDFRCPSTHEIKTAGGVKYKLSNVSNTCAACPDAIAAAGNVFR